MRAECRHWDFWRSGQPRVEEHSDETGEENADLSRIESRLATLLQQSARLRAFTIELQSASMEARALSRDMRLRRGGAWMHVGYPQATTTMAASQGK